MPRKYIAIITILVTTILVLALFIMRKRSENISAIPYHGPYPSYDVEETPPVSPNPTHLVRLTPTATPTPTKIYNAPKTTGSYQLGIAAGGILTGMDQNTLDDYFSTLNSIGANWVRWDIDWAFVQKDNQENYDWSGADMVSKTASKYGLNSLVTIAYAPRWAARNPCSYPACVPSDPITFGKFAGEVAQRYKNSITHFEIWNEPNYPLFWSQPDPVYYAELLKEAYVNIKTANNNSIVMNGGLAASENNGGSISPYTFIEALYNSGANKYLDAVAVHPYTYPAKPSFKANWNHWQEMTSIRTLMNSHGDRSKQIWITEYGAATGGPGKSVDPNQLSGFNYGSDYMTQSGQAELLENALLLHSQNNILLGPFFWYSLKDLSTNRSSPENFFGLIRFDGSHKPSYNVFQNATH